MKHCTQFSINFHQTATGTEIKTPRFFVFNIANSSVYRKPTSHSILIYFPRTKESCCSTVLSHSMNNQLPTVLQAGCQMYLLCQATRYIPPGFCSCTFTPTKWINWAIRSLRQCHCLQERVISRVNTSKPLYLDSGIYRNCRSQ